MLKGSTRERKLEDWAKGRKKGKRAVGRNKYTGKTKDMPNFRSKIPVKSDLPKITQTQTLPFTSS